MKKLTVLLAILLIGLVNLSAQSKHDELSFSDRNIKPADLIIEGVITNISYFRDTSEAVRNYGLRNPSRDKEGAIWFVEYTIEVQKLFKGKRTSIVTVIEQNYSSIIIIDNKEVFLSIGIYAHGNNGSNLGLNHLGIFFLRKDFSPKLNAVKNEEVYCFTEDRCIGNYNFLTETSIDIIDKGQVRKFDKLTDLYKYLEKETKTKKTDITHKQFFVNNSPEKARNYFDTHFADSSSSDSFCRKFRNGKINQLNKELHFSKPKTVLSKRELKENIRIRDSINVENKKKFLIHKQKFDSIIEIRKLRKQNL